MDMANGDISFERTKARRNRKSFIAIKIRIMKYLIQKLCDKIEEFGDGDLEFETRDIQHVLKRLEKLERNRDAQIKSLAHRRQGLHFHRIQENEDHEDDLKWNKTERAFYREWRALDDRQLEGLLHSDTSGLSLKTNYKAKVIAATLMQWLGSNLGWEFMQRALKREGYRIVKIEPDEQENLA